MEYTHFFIHRFIVFFIFTSMYGMQNEKKTSYNILKALRSRETGENSKRKLAVSLWAQDIRSRLEVVNDEQNLDLIAMATFWQAPDQVIDIAWATFTQELKKCNSCYLYITEWSRNQAALLANSPIYLDRLLVKVSDLEDDNKAYIREELFEGIFLLMAREPDEKHDDSITYSLKRFVTQCNLNINYYTDGTSLLHYLADCRRTKRFYSASKDIPFGRKKILMQTLIDLGGHPLAQDEDTGLTARELFVKTSGSYEDFDKKEIIAVLGGEPNL